VAAVDGCGNLMMHPAPQSGSDFACVTVDGTICTPANRAGVRNPQLCRQSRQRFGRTAAQSATKRDVFMMLL